MKVVSRASSPKGTLATGLRTRALLVIPTPPRGLPPCLRLEDTSSLRISAAWLGGRNDRGDTAQQARLAQQFQDQNYGILRDFGVSIEPSYDGARVSLNVISSHKVGALPLLSPLTGRPELGLIITPRFSWAGLGPLMHEMNWRVLPTPLRLPMLPRSERQIPPWVLATTVLFRIRAMLERLERRFEMSDAELSAPRGQVDWQRYAMHQMPRARMLDVPCRFPDLRDDRTLKAAIHYSLRKQLESLEGQRAAGAVVLRLIDLCQALLKRVVGVPASVPAPQMLAAWSRAPLSTQAFRQGLQAIEWTVDDRGLAGLSDLEGLPWIMSMEQFFEAWTEVLVQRLAQRIGGQMKTGRQRQTVTPLVWDPPYRGSQRALIPDVVLERGDSTIIVDAKYKAHWEELSLDRWSSLEDTLRERHREDLLQVLAYANLADRPVVTVVLTYPCRSELWTSLVQRGQTHHIAELRGGTRRVRVILTGLPMASGPLEDAVERLAGVLAA